MISYLEHDDIDFAKWDAAVDASAGGMVYAKSWYLNVVAPGWEALVEGDYQIIFPLTSRKKYGFRYLFQPPYTQQLGVFSKEIPDAPVVSNFLASIPGLFRLAEIQLHHSNKISKGDFKISERVTHLLDLAKNYGELQKKYSESVKRNLKRAQQNGLQITKEFKTAALTDLFKSNRGKEIETLTENDYRILEKLVEEGDKRNLITRLGIEINGKLEAGAIFMQSNHEYIFLFSATSDHAKETGAMTFIIDTFIRSHSSSTLQLDFEGSMDAGLARFYKSFGSEEVVYLQIRKNNLPLLIRWIKNSSQ